MGEVDTCAQMTCSYFVCYLHEFFQDFNFSSAYCINCLLRD